MSNQNKGMSAEVPNPKPDFVEGLEKMATDNQDAERRKDLTLCSVCMQWSCDGPECHRDDVCRAQDLG